MEQKEDSLSSKRVFICDNSGSMYGNVSGVSEFLTHAQAESSNKELGFWKFDDKLSPITQRTPYGANMGLTDFEGINQTLRKELLSNPDTNINFFIVSDGMHNVTTEREYGARLRALLNEPILKDAIRQRRSKGLTCNAVVLKAGPYFPERFFNGMSFIFEKHLNGKVVIESFNPKQSINELEQHIQQQVKPQEDPRLLTIQSLMDAVEFDPEPELLLKQADEIIKAITLEVSKTLHDLTWAILKGQEQISVANFLIGLQEQLAFPSMPEAVKLASSALRTATKYRQGASISAHASDINVPQLLASIKELLKPDSFAELSKIQLSGEDATQLLVEVTTGKGILALLPYENKVSGFIEAADGTYVPVTMLMQDYLKIPTANKQRYHAMLPEKSLICNEPQQLLCAFYNNENNGKNYNSLLSKTLLKLFTLRETGKICEADFQKQRTLFDECINNEPPRFPEMLDEYYRKIAFDVEQPVGSPQQFTLGDSDHMTLLSYLLLRKGEQNGDYKPEAIGKMLQRFMLNPNLAAHDAVHATEIDIRGIIELLDHEVKGEPWHKAMARMKDAMGAGYDDAEAFFALTRLYKPHEFGEWLKPLVRQAATKLQKKQAELEKVREEGGKSPSYLAKEAAKNLEVEKLIRGVAHLTGPRVVQSMLRLFGVKAETIDDVVASKNGEARWVALSLEKFMALPATLDYNFWIIKDPVTKQTIYPLGGPEVYAAAKAFEGALGQKAARAQQWVNDIHQKPMPEAELQKSLLRRDSPAVDAYHTTHDCFYCSMPIFTRVSFPGMTKAMKNIDDHHSSIVPGLQLIVRYFALLAPGLTQEQFNHAFSEVFRRIATKTTRLEPWLVHVADKEWLNWFLMDTYSNIYQKFELLMKKRAYAPDQWRGTDKPILIGSALNQKQIAEIYGRVKKGEPEPQDVSVELSKDSANAACLDYQVPGLDQIIRFMNVKSSQEKALPVKWDRQQFNLQFSDIFTKLLAKNKQIGLFTEKWQTPLWQEGLLKIAFDKYTLIEKAAPPITCNDKKALQDEAMLELMLKTSDNFEVQAQNALTEAEEGLAKDPASAIFKERVVVCGALLKQIKVQSTWDETSLSSSNDTKISFIPKVFTEGELKAKIGALNLSNKASYSGRSVYKAYKAMLARKHTLRAIAKNVAEDELRTDIIDVCGVKIEVKEPVRKEPKPHSYSRYSHYFPSAYSSAASASASSTASSSSPYFSFYGSASAASSSISATPASITAPWTPAPYRPAGVVAPSAATPANLSSSGFFSQSSLLNSASSLFDQWEEQRKTWLLNSSIKYGMPKIYSLAIFRTWEEINVKAKSLMGRFGAPTDAKIASLQSLYLELIDLVATKFTQIGLRWIEGGQSDIIKLLGNIQTNHLVLLQYIEAKYDFLYLLNKSPESYYAQMKGYVSFIDETMSEKDIASLFDGDIKSYHAGLTLGLSSQAPSLTF